MQSCGTASICCFLLPLLLKWRKYDTENLMKKYLTVFLAFMLAGCHAESAPVQETASAQTAEPVIQQSAEPEKTEMPDEKDEQRTDSGRGMTILLPESFTAKDTSGQPDSYDFYAEGSGGETILARCISRDAMVLITGRDDLSAFEFAQAYSADGTGLTEDEGFVWKETADASGKLILAFFAGESGYWNMSLVCPADTYEAVKKTLLDCARSVRFYEYDGLKEISYEHLRISLPQEMEQTWDKEYVQYSLAGCAVNISRTEKGNQTAEELLSGKAEEYGAEIIRSGEISYIVYISEDTGYINLMTAAESGPDLYTVVFMAPETAADTAEPLFLKYAGTIKTE